MHGEDFRDGGEVGGASQTQGDGAGDGFARFLTLGLEAAGRGHHRAVDGQGDTLDVGTRHRAQLVEKGRLAHGVVDGKALKALDLGDAPDGAQPRAKCADDGFVAAVDVGAKAFKLRGLLGRAVGHGCSVWSLF